MFTELTADEAKNLDAKLYSSEREIKGIQAALAIRPRTQKNLAKLEANFGVISDLGVLRDLLMVERPLTF